MDGRDASRRQPARPMVYQVVRVISKWPGEKAKRQSIGVVDMNTRLHFGACFENSAKNAFSWKGVMALSN